MDRALVRQWREGRRALEQFEDEEDRRATVADRWRRLQAIMQMARALGWIDAVDKEREKGVGIARE